jgi:transcriptional regulator with XRE-family HTH domain
MSVLNDLLDVYEKRISVRRGYARHGMHPPFEKFTGVSRSSISNWRTRKSGARLDSVEAVANALGYNLVLEKIEDRN